jgi:hypothetical protein
LFCVVRPGPFKSKFTMLKSSLSSDRIDLSLSPDLSTTSLVESEKGRTEFMVCTSNGKLTVGSCLHCEATDRDCSHSVEYIIGTT